MSGRWLVRASDERGYDKWESAMNHARRIIESGLIVELIVRPWTAVRSLEQNRKMWAMLTDIARSIPWVINGELQHASPAEWKDLLTAYLRRDLRIAQGLDGGVVILGLRTHRMTIRQMSDLIELMTAFGTERGVKWTDPEGFVVPPEEPEEL